MNQVQFKMKIKKLSLKLFQKSKRQNKFQKLKNRNQSKKQFKKK